MKCLMLALCTSLCLGVAAQDNPTSTKMILHRQLRTTHNLKDWFVPVNDALKGVTSEQAAWKDGSGNHSIGELVHHLLFWNERLLTAFKGNDPKAFSGDNEETFEAFDTEKWQSLVERIDAMMTEWETLVESASPEKLEGWYENLANISTHNAYHTGQIVYIRKLQGSWDPAQGVK